MTGWLTNKRVTVIGAGEVAVLIADALAAAGGDVVRASAWSDGVDLIAADALVLTGAPATLGAAIQMDIGAWRSQHSDDLDGRFLATAAFARAAIAAGRPGSVLMIAPRDGDAARATVNGALDNLVKSLAVEWARDGIRVNAVVSRLIAPDGGVSAGARTALGGLAAWLLGDYAVYVSGSIMGIDENGDMPHSPI